MANVLTKADIFPAIAGQSGCAKRPSPVFFDSVIKVLTTTLAAYETSIIIVFKKFRNKNVSHMFRFKYYVESI